MALIYRSIVEIEDGGFLDRIPEIASEWASWKLERDGVVLSPGDSIKDEERGMEVRCLGGEDGSHRAYRVELYEERQDQGEQVRSTFTAMGGDGMSWSWMDVERWTTDSASRAWIPFTPSLVRAVLDRERCLSGPTQLTTEATVIGAQEAPLLVQAVTEPDRLAPIVVVTANRDEDGSVPAELRARELARRLGGIGAVFILGPGAVTAFSKGMLERVGAEMDVHSGAVRVYVSKVGADRDHPRRHRWVPFYKLDGRPPDTAAKILVPPLLRRSAEMPPPLEWREHFRALVDSRVDRDYESMFELANEELTRAEAELENAQLQRLSLDEQLEEAKLENTELHGRIDDLQRRVTYLQTRLVAVDAEAAYAEPEEPFRPQFCSEVVAEARNRLDLVELHSTVDDGAAELDEHGDASWAPKAWTALQALQAYAVAKRDRDLKGDFKVFCANGEAALSTRSVALHEAETTRNNRRYRELRVLPVSTEVSADGKVFMEAHIRIELGGTPCPRIHFYDDTAGPTGKIHVGWFGDHLDSGAKS